MKGETNMEELNWKQKLKIKAARAGRKIKENIPGIVTFFGLSYMVVGLTEAHMDHKEIRRLKHNQEVIKTAINGNADILDQTIDRVSDLERQNSTLLEEALRRTEGKDPA